MKTLSYKDKNVRVNTDLHNEHKLGLCEEQVFYLSGVQIFINNLAWCMIFWLIYSSKVLPKFVAGLRNFVTCPSVFGASCFV